MSGGMMGDSMGGASSMSQTQADQINNSLVQIKDGLSSIIACVQGPDLRSGGLANSDAVKDSPYHKVLVGLNKSITECVKFLDEGDPEAAKRAKESSTLSTGGMMGGASMMGSGGLGGTSVTTVKNQPKVTMSEIDIRLKTFKTDVELLRNVMQSLEDGTTSATASR